LAETFEALRMRCALLAFVIAVAACGGDSSGPAAGFGCLGDTLPTTAPAGIAVTGQIRTFSQSPISGATVSAFRNSDTTAALATATSNTPGNYTLQLTTGGTPVDGYLRVTHSGQIDTYAYPSRPLTADFATNVTMITTAELALLGSAVGVTQTAGNGLIAVVVANCDGTPIAGATVTTSPAGTVRYNSGAAPSPSATSTAADGVAYVLNVAAGNVTVQASGGGHTLRQHIVTARADAVTLTEIQP
jgi:hypothetical protein